jgi:methylated-DNA-[protein]-cysteine S-methyltransferase
MKSAQNELLIVFPSALGWMGLRMAGPVVRQLAFGHPSAEAAGRAIDPEMVHSSPKSEQQRQVVRELKRYAEGKPTDFDGILLDPGPSTAFRKGVLDHCRAIPYGKTTTYGRLATAAGSPRACRAVGNCMATNPIPLIIPCHRVVASQGGPGPYSAPGGCRMKQRLLDLESRSFFELAAQLG